MKRYLPSCFLMALGVCALLLAMPSSSHAQTLAHRYSFFSEADGATNVLDSAGNNDGTFFGDATTISGQLVLDGFAYVGLQPGIITNDLAVTVEAWGDFPALGAGTTQGNWANLFDFGTEDANDNDSYSISFCVNTGTGGDGQLDAAISDFDNANTSRENCYNSGLINPLGGATGVYVAAVFNPSNNPGSPGYIAIYVNGTLNNKITIASTVTPGLRDLNNWIGRDNWPDPDMVGNLDEFRVWNGALNGFEIAASAQGGWSTINTNAGTITAIHLTAPNQNVVLGGQVPVFVSASASLITNTADITPLASYTSGNSNIVTVDASGNVHGVAVGTASVTASYQGKTSSLPFTVVEPVSVLAHRYSFTTDVSDSVGGLTGALMGDAVISNNAVVLDGTDGTYVDLSPGLGGTAGAGMVTGFQSTTIEYWATFAPHGISAGWQYGFAFGNSTGGGTDGINYIDQPIHDGVNQRELREAGGGDLVMQQPFTNETVHVVCVIDPPTGHLVMYTNGTLSGYVLNSFGPLSAISTNVAWIGRSLWYSYDPTVQGSYDEFRVWNGALTAQQAALSDLLGPNNANVTLGALNSVAISAPTLNVGDVYAGGVLLNYANLPNYNLLRNSLSPVLVCSSSDSNVVYQASDGKLHAVGPGTATVTATYQGVTGSGSVTVVAPAPVLVHRYSFHDAVNSTTVADSVGGAAWDGTLPNGGTFTGSNLQFSASSDQYAQLPAGILDGYAAVTIDTWATFPDALPGACFLFGFGNTDTNSNAGCYYAFCQPQNGRLALTGDDPGYDGEQGTGGAGNFSFQTNIHVTCVFDPPAGTESIYTNGVFVSTGGNSYSGLPTQMSQIQSVLNYIGRSLYTGDAYMDVTYNEFRIYNGAMTPDQVALSQALGSATLLGSGGTTASLQANVSSTAGSLVITWPTSVGTGFSLYSSPTLGAGASWTQVAAAPSVVGSNFQLTVPASGTAKFYVLKN